LFLDVALDKEELDKREVKEELGIREVREELKFIKDIVR
jgi:hypothetical protein